METDPDLANWSLDQRIILLASLAVTSMLVFALITEGEAICELIELCMVRQMSVMAKQIRATATILKWADRPIDLHLRTNETQQPSEEVVQPG